MRLPKALVTGGALLISGACILATECQLQTWRDGETLYLRAVAVSPLNDIPLIEGGITLANEGRNTEALALYQQAERIAPERYLIHNNLGNVLSLLGRHTEALAEYRTGISLRPNDAPLHDAAGEELATLGQFDAALREFSEAEKYDSTLATPHFETAKVDFKLGRDPEGVNEFRTALQLDPDNYQTLATIAHYLAASDDDATRDGKSALVLALKANEISGQNQPVVFDILGMAFAANGDFTNAVNCAQNALSLANAEKLKGTEQISARLELYRKSLPWRETFRATNAP
jgi:Flp pilus assembly protein TadD